MVEEAWIREEAVSHKFSDSDPIHKTYLLWVSEGVFPASSSKRSLVAGENCGLGVPRAKWEDRVAFPLGSLLPKSAYGALPRCTQDRREGPVCQDLQPPMTWPDPNLSMWLFSSRHCKTASSWFRALAISNSGEEDSEQESVPRSKAGGKPTGLGKGMCIQASSQAQAC